MDLTSRIIIKKLFKNYGFYPSKKFGQNFLINKRALKKIIEAADLKLTDIILEIGPGIGALTRELAKRVKKVIAVEKDPKMVEILKETLKYHNNIKVINGDILKIPYTNYQPQTTKYKIVANLPYYIVSPVIRKFLEISESAPPKIPPKVMILMVQKEVGQRICARPPRMNLLAVSIQFYATPEIISYVSKKSFWPQPKVDAAIIKISKLKSQISKGDKNLFFKIVKAGFSQPRKQLINNLSKDLKMDKEEVKIWLQKNEVRPTQRAETLNIKDWLNLTKTYFKA